ncbi:ATP-grasp domain-containing protein [Nakamurella antarctica]|uniref:ATP-grasp domain-containing protein n=1 Tax=Nakamurella antarctica TaxID=1902245 RepID=UPI0013DDB448|nr:ATP-grasp domain-containing protein [Nakamurella antarctica]
MPSLAIWLNRNYATTVHVLELLRNNPDRRKITLYGSHKDAASPMLTGCDHRFMESTLTGSAYVDYALQFCRDHRIKVFLPVYEQLAIALRANEFAEMGVAVICPSAESIELLTDKCATYQALGEHYELVPPWRKVACVAEFEQALEDLRPLGKPIVVKPARGVGADGVRFIAENEPTLTELMGPLNPTATAAQFVFALKQAQDSGVSINPLLVMPYLDSPEVSVDVLADHGKTVVAVPRSKVGRDRFLSAPEETMQAARLLVAEFGLDGLVNVQFRQWQGQAVLLEINTRPSGGLYQTAMAKLNMPWAAVKLALGEEQEELKPVLGARYVTVSSSVEMGSKI